ncbi:MAG: hypothetical protein INR69_05190 [Mucilaginibacter polytrichastri]|nr:hypothetical protein [Mucilaginibacter polytrichastri]
MRAFFTLFFCAFVLSACTSKDITVSVDSGGMSSGVFTVADDARKMINAQNLENGKCAMTFNALEPDYYQIQLSDNQSKVEYHEIYLEGGDYQIAFDKNVLDAYPEIKTASEKQNDLSLFYKLRRETDSDLKALQAFQQQKKDSEIGLHMMEKMDLSVDPVAFTACFDKLPADLKAGKHGKRMQDELTAMLRVMPGKKGPGLVGNTPDGKPFTFTPSPKARFIVLAFWKSANAVSRNNNKVLSQIKKQYDDRVEVISVSSDSKPDWLKTAVKDDQMDWYNVSDLKGSESVNLANYHITVIPTYMLLKPDFTIIDPDASVTSLMGVIGQSLR